MDMKQIGQRIRNAREAANITQEGLALAIGCTTKHIGAIERGIKTPRLDTFIAIANTLGTSADYLLQDFLDQPSELLAGEMASVLGQLPQDMQIRVLKGLRAFAGRG